MPQGIAPFHLRSLGIGGSLLGRGAAGRGHGAGACWASRLTPVLLRHCA